MNELVTVVQSFCDEMAKKIVDDFEQKAKDVLIEWFHEDPFRAIDNNFFAFEIKTIEVSDGTILFENNPIKAASSWDVAEGLYVPCSNDDTLIKGMSVPIKRIKLLLDEFNNRGYMILNDFNNVLHIGFTMSRE